MEITREADSRLKNYQPIPTNRKRRSKLYKVQKSNCLKNICEDNLNIGVNVNSISNKDKLEKLLIEKQLK